MKRNSRREDCGKGPGKYALEDRNTVVNLTGGKGAHRSWESKKYVGWYSDIEPLEETLTLENGGFGS